MTTGKNISGMSNRLRDKTREKKNGIGERICTNPDLASSKASTFLTKDKERNGQPSERFRSSVVTGWLECNGPVKTIKVMSSLSANLSTLFFWANSPVIGEPLLVLVCVEIFYGPVNTLRSCLARSVYLTALLLGRLSLLGG